MKKTSLGVNALLNGIKQACAVLFPFLSFVYCSRIIGKEGIGAYSFSQSIVSYFILLAALGIPNYAIREGAALRDNEYEIKKFNNQVFSINVISMIISYILLAGMVFFIPKFKDYSLVISILSAQLLLNTAGADWINTIFEDYIYLTIRYIVLQIVSFVCLFVFVKSAEDIIGYTIITMLSNVGGNIVNIYYLSKQKLYPRITKELNLKKHIIPIIILFANSIAGIVYLNSDITMLGLYLDESAVGVYTVSSKIYTLIKTLINAIIMVTIPRFSNYIANNNKEEYKKKLNDIANVVLLIALPCVTGMIVEAEKILLIVAGGGYEKGIAVVQVLGVSLIFAVGACLFSYSILMPNRKEKEFMIATIIAAIVNIILNLFCIPKLGIVGAATTTLIAEIIVAIMTVLFSRKIMIPSPSMKLIIESIVGGIIVFVTCSIANHVFTNKIICLAFEVVISIMLYFAFLVVNKNAYACNVTKRIKSLLLNGFQKTHRNQ